MFEIFGISSNLLFSQLLLGLINGAFYAMLSLGLAVIFGMLNVINFTHGAQYMMGAFAAWLMLSELNIPFWFALILSPIVVGLFGGTFSTPMPMFAFTGNTIMGSVTGTPAEMREMMDLVTAGKAEPVPIIKRKLDEADATLQDLRKGLVMGRAVLVP